MDSHPLQDKVVLVTGASSGIGAAIARQLDKHGVKLALCARRMDRLEQLANELGARTKLYQVDLRSEADILEMYSQIRKEWGGVDILINNAGLGHNAPLLEGSTEAFREMLEVNVLALSICTREAVTDMERNKRAGHVIHIGSMSGHRVPNRGGMYSATKHAVRALTEGLRQELRARQSPVRVTCVSPGFVETEFAEKFHQSQDAARQTYDQFKVLEAGDIARLVEFALTQPEHVALHDLLVRPTAQPT